MASEAARPPKPTTDAADQGTCDWGGCNDAAETWRYDAEHGWLPVCGKCSRTTWNTTGPGGHPRRRGKRAIETGLPTTVDQPKATGGILRNPIRIDDGLPAGLVVLANVLSPTAIRTRVVEQFTAALLTGLDELERDQHRRIGPGDVADLVARVAREVGRGTDPR